jgi:hypothetical protein
VRERHRLASLAEHLSRGIRQGSDPLPERYEHPPRLCGARSLHRDACSLGLVFPPDMRANVRVRIPVQSSLAHG